MAVIVSQDAAQRAGLRRKGARPRSVLRHRLGRLLWRSPKDWLPRLPSRRRLLALSRAYAPPCLHRDLDPELRGDMAGDHG